MNQGRQRSGVFSLPNGDTAIGNLLLEGAQPQLSLHSDRFFLLGSSVEIFGEFVDREQVSLLNCVHTVDGGSGHRSGAEYFFAISQPNVVVLGPCHITGSDKIVSSVSFFFDDDDLLFSGQNAFFRIDQEAVALNILLHGVGRFLPNAVILAYSGDPEIAQVDTNFGRIRCRFQNNISNAGPRGLSLSSRVLVEIKFENNLNVFEAIDRVWVVLDLFDVLIGRRQNAQGLKIAVKGKESDPIHLEVLLRGKRSNDTQSAVLSDRFIDALIRAGSDRDDFELVLRNWILRNDEWRDARARLIAGMLGTQAYSEERLTGAANVFDLLPASATPVSPISSELAAAQQQARQIFRNLPSSSDRDSILSALGRIGQMTLKKKALSRVEVLRQHDNGYFSGIELMVERAIDCRNQFVHGAIGKHNFQNNARLVLILTDALEFTFIMSDLVECGFNFPAWRARSTTLSHPLNRFAHHFPDFLSAVPGHT